MMSLRDLCLLACGSMLVGCAGVGEQYIPDSARSMAVHDLAVIQLSNSGNFTPQEITLNGVPVRKNRILLVPGPYVLEYKAWDFTPEWRRFQKEMEAKGYKAGPDGTFKQYFERDGQRYVKELIPVSGIKRLDWLSRSKELDLKAGEELLISKW